MLRLVRKVVLVQISAAIVGCAQNDSDAPKFPSLPQPVQAAIEASYGDATVVHHWRDRVEGRPVHEVTLRRAGRLFDVSYSAEGELLETETPLSEHELPTAVSEAVAVRHPGFRLVKAEEVRPARGLPVYEVSLVEKDVSVKTRYDRDGELVSETRMQDSKRE